MAWQDAKQEGDKWAAENLPLELRGQVLQLVAFESDEECRFFYPDRPAEFHKMVTTAIARQARKRKAKITYATVTRGQYEDWIQVHGKEDSPAQRLSYAAGMHILSAAEA